MNIELEDIHFSRGNKKILNNINIKFASYKINGIIGPSGCGKTTLLKIVTGQLKPDSGKVLFDGKSLWDMHHQEMMNLRKKMGMLFQHSALLTNYNVFDNVALPLREHTQLPENMIYSLVLAKLQAVGLRGVRDLNPSKLSGGMMRRVAFARAIILDPQVIFYDEPFVGQDPISMGVLIRLIKLMSDAMKLTSITVSHDISELLNISDQVFLLYNGEIADQGTSEHICNSKLPMVQQFIEGKFDGPIGFHQPANDYQKDLYDGC